MRSRRILQSALPCCRLTSNIVECRVSNELPVLGPIVYILQLQSRQHVRQQRNRHVDRHASPVVRDVATAGCYIWSACWLGQCPDMPIQGQFTALLTVVACQRYISPPRRCDGADDVTDPTTRTTSEHRHHSSHRRQRGSASRRCPSSCRHGIHKITHKASGSIHNKQNAQ